MLCVCFDSLQVKNVGVSHFLSACKTSVLAELSFSGTQISDEAFVNPKGILIVTNSLQKFSHTLKVT